MRIARCLVLSAFVLAAPRSGPGQESPPAASPQFGTTTVVYQRLSPPHFHAVRVGFDSPTLAFTFDGVPPSGTALLYPTSCTPGVGCHVYASPQLPGGALLTYVELDSCDTGAADHHVRATLYDCDYRGTCVTAAPVASVVSLNGGCGSSAATIEYTVDNFTRQLLLDVEFDETGGTNGLAGFIFGYRLQVSPAPAVATFGDVPTSSPQFQFVQALVAAGITAGCGGGNYCPDNPVTRGQMAVFLARALGLNWN